MYNHGTIEFKANVLRLYRIRNALLIFKQDPNPFRVLVGWSWLYKYKKNLWNVSLTESAHIKRIHKSAVQRLGIVCLEWEHTAWVCSPVKLGLKEKDKEDEELRKGMEH